MDHTHELMHRYMVGDVTDRPDYQSAFDNLIETWKEVFVEEVWVVARMQMRASRTGSVAGSCHPITII